MAESKGFSSHKESEATYDVAMRRILVLFLLLTACSSAAPEAMPDPTPTGCSSGDFAYSVGATEGAAGTSYTTLIFTNTSTRECTLEGVPGAQPVSGQEPVGPESKHNDLSGKVETIVVKQGEKASVLFAVATASNYPTEECVPLESDGVMVTLGSESARKIEHTFSLRSFDVCTELASTSISKVARGIQG